MGNNDFDMSYLQLASFQTSKEANGSYRVQYRLRDSGGKIVKQSGKRGFRTLREAKAFSDKLRQEHAEEMFRADHPSYHMTFGELYEKYRVSRLGDKPSTILNRENMIELHILPFFRDMQIDGITQDTISQWHSTFYGADGKAIFSATYIRAMHSRLSAVLNYAVNCGWLQRNPARNCSIGEKNASERPVWTPAEYQKFRAAAETEPQYYYAFELLYLTGMRKGELYGLTLGDIDFDKKTVRINKSLQFLKGQEVLTSPKTKMSVRTVRLNDKLLAELQEYIAMMPGLTEKSRLFPITNGQLQNALERISKRAGLDYISLHCFRHSHITNLIAAGFSPADIAKRVGHESIYITLHYSHAFKNVDEEMAKRLDEGM